MKCERKTETENGWRRETEKEGEGERKGEKERRGVSRSLTSANPISTRDVPHPPRGAEAALRR